MSMKNHVRALPVVSTPPKMHVFTWTVRVNLQENIIAMFHRQETFPVRDNKNHSEWYHGMIIFQFQNYWRKKFTPPPSKIEIGKLIVKDRRDRGVELKEGEWRRNRGGDNERERGKRERERKRKWNEGEQREGENKIIMNIIRGGGLTAIITYHDYNSNCMHILKICYLSEGRCIINFISLLYPFLRVFHSSTSRSYLAFEVAAPWKIFREVFVMMQMI